METYQERFQGYLMSMVKPGSEAAAQAILAQAFGQQSADQFTPDQVSQAIGQLAPLLTDEGIAKLNNASWRMDRRAAHVRDRQHPDDPQTSGEWYHQPDAPAS
jgi:hypothetical protein